MLNKNLQNNWYAVFWKMGRTSLKTRIAISKRRTRLPQTSYNLNQFDASYKSHTSPAIGPEHLLVCNLMQSIWHEKSLRAAKPRTSHVHFSWGVRILNANVIITTYPTKCSIFQHVSTAVKPVLQIPRKYVRSTLALYPWKVWLWIVRMKICKCLQSSNSGDLRYNTL